MADYCKRLIEVDLPIKRISAHARREKSIRHGHISTLHIWWARRPLAACRAVICASLWPDPADPLCPKSFVKVAKAEMKKWSTEHLGLLSEESYPRFNGFARHPKKLDNMIEIRKALLDFIADFANWDNSTVREYLDTSRALTQAAHEALGGAPGTRPLVVDPFAGGGSIPLEALRVGADAFASDLNPVPVLLNKVVLEYIPKYGQRLADEVRKWGAWIKSEAKKELAEFYPKEPDGATAIAYLWARAIKCEGPGCGAEVPLIRSLWLAKKANRSVALQIVPNPKARRVDFQIVARKPQGWVVQREPTDSSACREAQIVKDPKFDGTVKRGSATCPCCGYTTPVARVREQLKRRTGGTGDAFLYCVVCAQPNEKGRSYRLARQDHRRAATQAQRELQRRVLDERGTLSLVPNEPIPIGASRTGGGSPFTVFIYGMEKWGDLFSPRQALALTTLARFVGRFDVAKTSDLDPGLVEATKTCLALAVDRQADYLTSLTIWASTGEFIAHTFGRQALPIVWEWPECQLFADGSGNWDGAIEWVSLVIEAIAKIGAHRGHSQAASAIAHPLPDDAAGLFFTDPPYYDAVPYADLSDFFYVWLKRTLPEVTFPSSGSSLTPKDGECVVDLASGKDRVYFERTMCQALVEGRRVLAPNGIGVVVFAHKSTAGWEAQLQAIIDSGWIITGSWPIDTERPGRLRSQDSAALASSVHLICRPREHLDGSLHSDDVGDWRDVLAELPRRIREWMPRLAEEGVVGADAIFACLGPALEIFSRYSRVEKASGDAVTLMEYLEEVWAAVAKEALTLVFAGADASGFEEDARLTAMWLWTLYSAAGIDESDADSVKDEESDGEDEPKKPAQTPGYVLEFDAARKIAQGLGAHLEGLAHLVEIKGDKAILLSAGARARYLFGKDAQEPTKRRNKKKAKQLALDFGQEMQALDDETDGEWAAGLGGRVGSTTLDQLHQSMILFGAGRGEALRRLLVEEGVGRNARFWALAQALGALYPPGADERRWVEGVQARKKGLGL